MKPLLICIEDAWKVSGRCLDQSFWTKVCKYVSFQTKLFSDHKENPKENSSVALLSLSCLLQLFNTLYHRNITLLLINVEYHPDHLLHGGGPAHVQGLAGAHGDLWLAG